MCFSVSDCFCCFVRNKIINYPGTQTSLIRYDTRCYFDMRLKADISRLIYRVKPTTKKWKTVVLYRPIDLSTFVCVMNGNCVFGPRLMLYILQARFDSLTRTKEFTLLAYHYDVVIGQSTLNDIRHNIVNSFITTGAS